ncbi:MAG: phage baseplate assembly protein V [Robiginitomaculum sp.]|nr:phage baseplate assembly protein V [Robiginitomaculum sp.]
MNSRQLHNIIAIGTIFAISDDGKSAQVKIGDITTNFRPLPAVYGLNFTAALPTHIHAQVVLNCPSGDYDGSVIVGFLWPQGEAPYTADTNIDGIKFADGTLVEYDSAAGSLKIDCAGDINITAAGTLTMAATKIIIEGEVEQIGGDMTSDGISAQTHIHEETSVLTKVPQ